MACSSCCRRSTGDPKHRQLTAQLDAINNRINSIGTTLDRDVDCRVQRISASRTVDPDVVDRYKLSVPTLDTPQKDVDRWVKGVARAEQHHTAWQGQNVSRGTPEWAAQANQQRGVDLARRRGLDALQRSIPQIHRPGPDLGISR